MLNFFLASSSPASILLPCSKPFKWCKPWINRSPMNLRGVVSNCGDCLAARPTSMNISPLVLVRGKESTFAGLFIPRRSWLSLFESVLPISTRESSYSSPSTKFFISAKGKFGSLPFVLFFMSNVSSVTVLFFCRSEFSEFFEMLDSLCRRERFKDAAFLAQF